MREIKFRVYIRDVLYKKLTEMYDNVPRICMVVAMYPVKQNFMVDFIFCSSGGRTAWSGGVVGVDIDLMQYTGIKDCNKNEIYGGDIAKALNSRLYRIYWAEVFGGFQGLWSKGGENDTVTICGVWASTATIIGNKYENPELIMPKGGE